jgi:hypothetical protein
MAKQKIDGVVEAVRYTSDGQIEWVRAYEWRGAVFSDHVLIRRPDFIARLKAGKRFVAGKRILYLGGKFETSYPVQLMNSHGSEVIVAGTSSTDRDRLEGVPLL